MPDTRQRWLSFVLVPHSQQHPQPLTSVPMYSKGMRTYFYSHSIPSKRFSCVVSPWSRLSSRRQCTTQSSGVEHRKPILAAEHEVSRAQIKANRPLERLSTTHLLRSVAIGTAFTSPRLVSLGISTLKWLASPRRRWLANSDKNPALRALVRWTVYDHFCAGVNAREVRKRVSYLKSQGFAGVMVAPGHETFVEQNDDFAGKNERLAAELEVWQALMLETISMAGPGDYVGMKFTASGPSITEALLKDADPPAQLIATMDIMCSTARSQGTKIWVDAEQQILQSAIDRWTVIFMSKYNRDGQAVLYNTYQAYLKDIRPRLYAHLKAARDEGWTMGVKLVRGAYIASDPRDKIHDTKAETDASYDGIVRDLLTESFGDLQGKTFPAVEIFVAGHNIHSIRKAAALSATLIRAGKRSEPVKLGQLLGMADEASYELLNQAEELKRTQQAGGISGIPPFQPYKCVHWGPVRACLHYMIRRATENAGAAARLSDSVRLMRQELWMRCKPW